MSAPPATRLEVSVQEAAAMGAAVRDADLSLLSDRHRLAGIEYVAGLIALLADHAASDPIYDLPRLFTPDVIAVWISDAKAKQTRGEGQYPVSARHRGRGELTRE